MTGQPTSSAPPPGRSGIVVPHRLTWHKRLLASLIYLVLRSLAATLRFEWHLPAAVLHGDPAPAIFCVWHNRLAVALSLYQRYTRRRRQPSRLAAIVSASKDGAVVARITRDGWIRKGKIEDTDALAPWAGGTVTSRPRAALPWWAER